MSRDPQIEKIQSAVESAEHIPDDKKAELLGLIAMLDPVIAKVAQTHDEDAQHIAGLVKASAQEPAPERRESLLHELKQSVERFEASHPDLVSFVTEYSAFLSALGI